MKKYSRKILLSAVILMLIWGFFPQLQVQAAVKTGTMGTNDGFTWSYDDKNKVLTFTGRDSGLEKEGLYTESGTQYRRSPFYGIDKQIKKIIVKDCTIIGDASYLFDELEELESITFENFDTSKVTNMTSMFSECGSLTSLDVSGFDTAQVKLMSTMFYDCSMLTELNLSGFNTANVECMGGMFQGCVNLTSLDVSKFNTKNVSNMMSMFTECNALTALDVSGFDTSKVRDMRYMFLGCRALSKLDLSGFVTSKVMYMGCMFNGCKSLTTLDLSGFDTEGTWEMVDMFRGCSGLKKLNLAGFDTKGVEIDGMLYGCSALTTIYTPQKMEEGQTLSLGKTFYDTENTKWTSISAKNTDRILCTTQMVFADVEPFSWQYDPAQYVYSKNIMVGKDTDDKGKIIFDPNANMTRAEFVQTLYNKEKKPSVKVSENLFLDVKSTDWYAKAVTWATNKGIVSGKGDKFGVSDNITREEVATILYNYAKYKKLSTKKTQDFTGYTDADQISSWAVERMQWALAYGIMKGKGDRLDPKGNATRAECATMIKNFIDAY